MTLTNGGLFTADSTDVVCCGSPGANLQVDVYGAGDAYLGTSNFAASANTTILGNGFVQYSRLRFIATGSHFSLDNFVGDAVGGVPEPATWGMMIVGFGLVGAAARRRKALAATA